MLAGIYYGAQYGGSTTAILVNIPGEATVGRHHARRARRWRSKGQAGIALGIAAHRLVLRRHGGDARHRGDRRAADQARAAVRAGRIFRADGARPRPRRRAGARLGAQGRHHGRVRPAARDRRHRSRDRPGAPDARASRTCPTASTSPCWPWACSASPRSCATSRTRRPATWCEARSAGCCRRWRTCAAAFGPIAARHRPRRRSSASCPATARCSRPFASYTLEKKLAKDPSRFGRGAIEGVAGPEAANNAGAQTAFIPLLTLGIPPNAVMALMVGAMTIHGIIPGPAGHDQEPRACSGA